MLCIALAVGTLTGCGSKKEDNRLVIWTNMNVEVDTLQKYADTWGEQNGYEVGLFSPTLPCLHGCRAFPAVSLHGKRI